MRLSTGFKWLGTRSNGVILETRNEPLNSTKARHSLTNRVDNSVTRQTGLVMEYLVKFKFKCL